MAEGVFWLSFLALSYTYIGYPLVLWVWSRSRPRQVRKDSSVLSVSVVIAAHNEAKNIAGRIENCLGVDYPSDRLEVIIVSDGSDDGTVDTVSRYVGRRVKVIILPDRAGKAVALSRGVAIAKGEVIVFTDARQRFAPSAVAELVANFADPLVGAVSGELVLVEEQGRAPLHDAGLYWRYEKWIRKAESRIDSVIGATGAIYGIRKALFVPLPAGTILDDVMIPMRIALQGYRVVFEENAVAYDALSANIEQEFRRKVRTLAGNYQLFRLVPELWSPFQNRLLFLYLSHKVTRLLAPFGLLALLAASVLLASGPYAVTLWLQIVFYGLAWAGWHMRHLAWRIPLTSVPLTFVMLNCAAVLGLVQFLRGWCGGHGETDLWVKS